MYVLTVAANGPPLRSYQDAVDLVGLAWESDAALVVVPVQRLHEDFFELRSGVAGEIVGKLTSYRIRLVVLGDVSRHVAASTSLRAFVEEANRGREVWFVTDAADLDARIGGDA
ncbi:MAG: DUF4180 domain-containing protein [Pseudonocardia sp.]|nr:DUF4180 domain-containing protein [Pseudonocardia sp.]